MISVIVPVFNTEINALKKCLSCLSEQTYSNIEVIIVDASTESYIDEVLDAYLKDNRFIKIKDYSNICVGRNIGLDNCHGNYIICIDSDDFFDENFIGHLYRKIKTNDYDVAVPMTHRCVYSDGKLVEEMPYEICEVNERVTKDNFFKYTRPAELVEARKLYKASLIKDVRFDVKCTYGETLLFNYELAKLTFTTCFAPEAIYYYRVIKNSNSGERRFDSKGWYLVKKLASIIRSKEIKDKDAIDGLYNEFDFAFNLFYYALARHKKIFRLIWMIKYKTIYLKRHHNFHDILYMLFPIIVVSHRSKNKKHG